MIDLGKIPPEVWEQGFGPVRVSPLAEALRAYRAGDETLLWEFMGKRRLGHKINAASKVSLRGEFRKAEEEHRLNPMQVPLLVVRREIDAHGGRLRQYGLESEEKLREEWKWGIREGIKRPLVERALATFAVKGQVGKDGNIPPKVAEALLWNLLPGIAFVEDQHGDVPLRKVGGKVTDAIRHEAFESVGDPYRTAVYDPSWWERQGEDDGLLAFMQRERLAREVHDAGLSEQEMESWMFSIILESNEDAADLLGRSPGQVAVEKSRAKEKLQARRTA
jgi:hypothetical protein